MTGFVSCCACDGCSYAGRSTKEHSNLDVNFATAGEMVFASVPAANEDGTDIPGDSSTAATISIGETVVDELEVLDDQDWFAIELTAGQSVTISLTGTGENALSDPYLRVYDADGNLVASNDDGGEGLNSLMRFTAQEGGTYYIEADSYASSSTGTYTLIVEEAEPLEVFSVGEIATQLTEGYWGGSSRAFDVGEDGILTVNISGLGEDEQALARAALDLWGDITGITFSEIETTAEINFTNTEEGAYATSSRFAGRITSSTVNIETAWVTRYGTGLETYSFQTYVHEIGHALGLGHAGNYNGNASYASEASYLNDSWATTVMSYFDQRENSYFAGQGFTYAPVTSPMIADVAAIVDLYGAATDTRLGNTVYGFNSTSDRAIHDASTYANTAYSIVDSGGYDTLDYSGFSNNQLIDLRQEAFMNIGGERGTITIARGTIIEVANGGSGNDEINGNWSNNILRGNAGADLLRGFDGNDVLRGHDDADVLWGGGDDDRLYGGEGDDTLNGEVGNDSLYGDGGNDSIQGSFGWDTIYGGTGADALEGNGGNDYVNGQGGNDTIAGGLGDDELRGETGNDAISGGDGRDRIFGDDGNDTLSGGGQDDRIFAGNGTDTVSGGAGNDYIEGAVGNDLLLGDADDDVLIGGFGWDTLDGGDGNDVLDGGNGNDRLEGGAGLDTLTGGAGRDEFVLMGHSGGNAATLADFTFGEDTILLDRSEGLGALDLGSLAAGAFNYGPAATQADDRIIYQPSTGNIFYDEDGVGGVDAILIATVEAGTTLGPGSFRAIGEAELPAASAVGAGPLLGADMVMV